MDRPGEPAARDWRRVHRAWWFWIGFAMLLTAILAYVFSEDLSLRPQRPGSAGRDEGREPPIRSGL